MITRSRDTFSIEVLPYREKRRTSRSNPRHNPPAVTGAQAAGLVLAGPWSLRTGNYDVIPVPGSPPQGPGIMRRGELCSCRRCTISCAAL